MTKSTPVPTFSPEARTFVAIREAPTLAQVRKLPATVDVVRAAAALGIGKSTAYEVIASGQFPCQVLTVRGRKRVITASLVQVLSQTGTAG